MNDGLKSDVKEKSEVYLCENCGGNMEYDIQSEKLKCPYCDTIVEIVDEKNIKEYSFADVDLHEKNSDWNNEVEVLKCESCGAETVADKHATAVICAYCGSSHVLNVKQTAGIKPEGVIPFKIDRNKAQELSSTWFKRRWLAPNDLKLLYQSEKLQPVYVPYWTYDADTYSTYTGEGGQNYYVTVERDGKKYQELRVRWYRVNGRINRFFDDVLVNASSNYNDSLMNAVEPFHTGALKSYTPEYLSGYTAERYSKGVKSCFETAKMKMQSVLVSDATTQILKRYDQARFVQVSTQYSNVTYKHVLLPVWSAYYDYKGKKYQYLVNGQTGEVQGDAPYSWVKITLIIILITIICVAIYIYSNHGG